MITLMKTATDTSDNNAKQGLLVMSKDDVGRNALNDCPKGHLTDECHEQQTMNG